MQRRQFTARLASPFIAAVAAGPIAHAMAVPRPSKEAARLLTRQLADIETAAGGGRLGVSVLDTGSGWQASHRPDERFPMCSTFKFLLAAATLQRVDRQQEQLTRRIPIAASDLITHSPTTEKHVGPDGLSVAALCEATMTLSDNAAANLLLVGVGGPPGLTRFMRSLDDTVTRLDRTEPGLNEGRPGDPRDTTSPLAMRQSMQKILLGKVLSPVSRELLLGWLVANKTGDARLRAGLKALGSEWTFGDKTGSGSNATNDIAILLPPGGRAPVLLTAYFTESTQPDAVRSATLAKVGQVVASTLRG